MPPAKRGPATDGARERSPRPVGWFPVGVEGYRTDFGARSRWRRAGLVVLVIAVGFLGRAMHASAYVESGNRPWPHGVIRYFNSDEGARTEVAAAVAAWNHSGAHVHFVATSRARASVIVYRWPRHISAALRQACSSQDLGCASVGFVGTIGNRHYLTIGIDGEPQAKGYVYLKAPNPSHLMPVPLMDVVATHEFGHLLGLGHSQRCATMDAPVDSLCKLSDNSEGDGYICNPLQIDDARGAVALYGGHAHTYAQRICDFVSPPIAPIGLTATLINSDPQEEYLGDIQISFRAPQGEELHYPSKTINTVNGYVYTVNLNTCVDPTAMSYGGGETAKAEVTTPVAPSPAQPGTYCVTVENHDAFGQLSAPAEADVTVPPVPSS